MAWIAMSGVQQPEADHNRPLRPPFGGFGHLRDLVNRQTTITLASAAMPLPSAQRGSRQFRRRMSARFPPGTFPGSMSYPAVRRSLYW